MDSVDGFVDVGVVLGARGLALGAGQTTLGAPGLALGAGLPCSILPSLMTRFKKKRSEELISSNRFPLLFSEFHRGDNEHNPADDEGDAANRGDGSENADAG